MSKVRIPINPKQVGRVGAYTMYVRGGEQIVRQRQNASNYGESASRSLAQQLRRVKWSNLVSMFRVMSAWQPRAYETLKPGQTDYNKFMSINIDQNSVAFTKEEAASGAVVIEPVIVSQGSLQAVQADQFGGLDIGFGGDYEAAPANLGELAERVIRWNNWKDGDNLAFIAFTNEPDQTGVPRAESFYFEWTLDTSSTESLSSNPLIAASNAADNENGLSINLGSIVDGGAQACVGIHTRQESSGLKVSTERIGGYDRDLVHQYSTQAQIDKAVASYGLSTQVPLQPGSSDL